MRQRRRQRDLTQRQLAELVFCAPITIRKIEADERRPSATMARRLAEALDLDEALTARFEATARGERSPADLPSGGASPQRRGPTSPPARLTSLVGRQRELSATFDLLAVTDGPARLLTLTGPPGVGKTAVAMELARRVETKLEILVAVVELADLTDPGLVTTRIAEAFDAPLGSRDPLGSVAAAVANDPVLLVIDNAEHLLPAMPALVELLSRSPLLTVVATSRVRLDLEGEHVVALEPLQTPPADLAPTAVDPEAWPAVALFLERAVAAGVVLTLPEDLATVVDICRQVDGVPLALELAARAGRHRTVTDLHGLLASAQPLSSTGRDRAGRQRTMDEAIRWSVDLVSVEAGHALAAAAMFARPSVARVQRLLGADPSSVDVVVDELLDHGLLRLDRGDLRLLHVVRTFAVRRAEHAAVLAELRDRHAEVIRDEVVGLTGGRMLTTDSTVTEAVGALLDDVAAAIRHCVTDGDAAVARALCSAVGYTWTMRDRWHEGLGLAAPTLQTATDPAERAWLSGVVAELRWSVGDIDGARDLLDQAIDLARRSSDLGSLAAALGNRGLLAMLLGDLADAEALCRECHSLHQELGQGELVALSHLRLSRLAMLRGDLDGADNEAERALAWFRPRGTAWGIGTALGNLADHAVRRRDGATALTRYREAIDAFVDGSLEWFAASRLHGLADALVLLGRPELAASAYGTADKWLHDLGVPLHPVVAGAGVRDEVERELGEGWITHYERGATTPPPALLAEI